MFFIQQNEDVIPRGLVAKGVTGQGEVFACDVVLCFSHYQQSEWLSYRQRTVILN